MICDTAGIHNGYLFWGVVRRADFSMHQTLYGKIGGVERAPGKINCSSVLCCE